MIYKGPPVSKILGRAISRFACLSSISLRAKDSWGDSELLWVDDIDSAFFVSLSLSSALLKNPNIVIS